MEEYAKELHRLYGSGTWEDACAATSTEAVIEAALHGFVPTCVEADAYLVQVTEGVVETGVRVMSETLLSLCAGWEVSATAMAGSVRLKRVGLRERVVRMIRTGTCLSHPNLALHEMYGTSCSLSMRGTHAAYSVLFSAVAAEVAANQCVALHPWLESLDWKACP